MKKILFTLLAMIATLGVNAQGIEIYKDGTLVDAYNGSTYKAVLTKTPATLPTTIKLNRTCVGMRTGCYYTLVATVSDGSAVTWKSDNTGVATVSKGLVKAIASGTTTITATANGQSAICTINVDYVDFGGTIGKVAVCNLGANFDIEYGNKYCWGETSAIGEVADDYPTTASGDWTSEKNTNYPVGSKKTEATYANYKWGTYFEISGYCENLYKYTDDDHKVLEASDDAATVNLGSDWKMMSPSQATSLLTTNKYVDSYDGTGIRGFVYFVGTDNTSLSNPHIFIPLDCGSIWLNEAYSSSTTNDSARQLYLGYNAITKAKTSLGYINRDDARAIRAVKNE